MKSKKQDFLVAAKAAGLLALARKRTAPGIRILCYHGIWLGNDDFPGDSMFMRQSTFERRLQIIRREGYPVVKLADAIAHLQGTGPALPPCAVVITIDDGWFGTHLGMLPALTAHAMPATLYCDTAQLTGALPIAHVMARYLDKIANAHPDDAHANHRASADVERASRLATDLTRTMTERLAATRELATAIGIDLEPYLRARAFEYMSPRELREAHTQGLDVQLHTHDHTLGDMSEQVISDQIDRNQKQLSALLGVPTSTFNHFCYPSGVASPEAARSLERLGLTSSTTTVQGIAYPGTDLHLLPRLLDGENLSEIEFEAELSGFGNWMRHAKSAARGITAPLRRGTGATASAARNLY